MATAADRARQKAEARRLRILARSAQRLDAVSGNAPMSSPSVATNSMAVTPSNAMLDGATVASGVMVDVPPIVEDKAPAADAEAEAASESVEPAAAAAAAEVDAAAAAETAVERPSAGARRMAAMRRRRYQSKNKPKEEAKEDEGNVKADEVKKEEQDESKKDENDTTNTDVDGAKADGQATASDSAAAEKSVKESEPAKIDTTKASTEEKEDKENVPVVVTPTATSSASPEEKKEEETSTKPKKYMGVARMRRKILKEQKAQRLKDIAESEVMISNKTSTALERELAAEMATMDITAKMVRQGGIPLDDSKVKSLSAVAMKSGLKKKWYMKLLPPMRLMPRLVTLLLLFFAGMDLGSQPHYHRGGSQQLDAGEKTRDLNSLSVATSFIHLIHHAEPKLTKPWEYGMGGKVAYLAGMAPSSPPTSLPTSFSDAGVCTADDNSDECMAPKDSREKNKGDKGGKNNKKHKNIKVQLMEDEFDSSRARPRGVSNHDDEFGDSIPTTGASTNIDPLFQVDLDALLTNAQLPFPIDFAAKCAIGFHRTWVYYLWTLPVKLMKSMINAPKNIVTGWISNPPWILGVALLMQLLARILAGSSLETDKDGNAIGASDKGGGGGGSLEKNFDVLQKITETAKNYATSTFPKTTLVLGTLMKVMKVDMYVILCGMLIGLVTPSIKENYYWGFTFGIGSGGGGAGGAQPTLGDEL